LERKALERARQERYLRGKSFIDLQLDLISQNMSNFGRPAELSIEDFQCIPGEAIARVKGPLSTLLWAKGGKYMGWLTHKQMGALGHYICHGPLKALRPEQLKYLFPSVLDGFEYYQF